MDEKALQNLRARADAKLSYAKIHLDELKSLGTLSGSDFDRAHQESFLFHLLGAKDAFLIELNAYYGVDLPKNDLTIGKLRKKQIARQKDYAEVTALSELEKDKNSWLLHAKEMRDHSTHVSGVPRTFHCGGPTDGEVWLRLPQTGRPIERHFAEEFDAWVSNMRELLERLRSSAIETMRLNNRLNPTRGADTPLISG